MRRFCCILLITLIGYGYGGNSHAVVSVKQDQEIDELAGKAGPDVIRWRRDFHQHPELGNREFRTAEIIAETLKRLNLNVKTGVAHTGVVGILEGRSPEPVVALRAEMDALPITENTGLSYASKATMSENGEEVGVMHACGHDAHMAILMGTAAVLSQMRDRIPGSVKFIFQPAEEGTAAGGIEGANLMVREGVLENPAPVAIFGLHVETRSLTGTVGYRSEGAMASIDDFTIDVTGLQTHGAMPWQGVDPIVTASQIILGLQTIISRQISIITAPAVISVGSIHGGSRTNIIPQQVILSGTIRCLDRTMRLDIHDRMNRVSTQIAQSSGADARLTITPAVPPVYNDPEITAQAVPILQRVAGSNQVPIESPVMAGDDFAYYQEKIPGFFFWLGVTPPEKDPSSVPPLHSSDFYLDESSLLLGVRIFCNLVIDYLSIRDQQRQP
jgi:amidohydrolase